MPEMPKFPRLDPVKGWLADEHDPGAPPGCPLLAKCHIGLDPRPDSQIKWVNLKTWSPPVVIRRSRPIEQGNEQQRQRDPSSKSKPMKKVHPQDRREASGF